MFDLPNYIYLPLEIICIILVTVVFANLIYFTMLSLFGLIKPKRDYQIVKDQHRFLFLVPAHNEEDVIGPTIESLINQNYDSTLFDIVIIADNCTDNTVEVIEKYERAEAFVNTSKADEPRGKPHAIARFIETGRWKVYDYIAFIDADNIVDKNYLMEMNSQLIARPELTVVQGYLGVKNVATSMTASGYAAVYFITNRAVQYANYRLGWNAAIGGTGFVLQTMYLEKNGWNPRSYTEDFELQVELSLQSKKSGWNHFAVVYDEKPNSVIASHNQRTRWAQGHWFVAFTTTWKQVKSIFHAKSIIEGLSKCETLFYSYSMVRPIAFLLIISLALLDKRLLIYLPDLFSLLLFWLVIEFLNFLVIPTVYFLQEASAYFDERENFTAKVILYFRLIVGFVWNSITYMVAQVVGFFTWFKPQNNWKKTVHSATFDRNQ
ncbi:glycosyltransferase family 2 protein [Carnobacterium divergens]|uniref:Glycosyltransferase family 2 protein n=1 Tax=Carnobacterium divergens TaxID=2748 RepID=A0AAW8R7H5_CARDV|nr:glycosyltransferase family 2 protein [Carnobacterium divergens]MDT1957042.1 glycosyltransferase family 2 protein [Carnobacterium divergens]MDT1973012.1 glycosyltransferase family 2 protein [Carnobacterium divergens]